MDNASEAVEALAEHLRQAYADHTGDSIIPWSRAAKKPRDAWLAIARAAIATLRPLIVAEERDAKVGRAARKSNSFAGAIAPYSVTLNFRNGNDRDAFIDAHVAAIREQADVLRPEDG